MGSEELPDNQGLSYDGQREGEQTDDELASKLSRELSNWRRRRTNGRARQADDASGRGSFQSEPARTIKVRGHETLVIRKSKLAPKPRNNEGSAQGSD